MRIIANSSFSAAYDMWVSNPQTLPTQLAAKTNALLPRLLEEDLSGLVAITVDFPTEQVRPLLPRPDP